MRSCVKALAAVALAAIVVPLAAAPKPTAQTAYRQLLAREATLRQDLQAQSTPTRSVRSALLSRVRTTITRYEGLARTYPTSGYSDNALWQGAVLAADAFWQFGESADRQTARRLLDELGSRFPSSSLVSRIPAYKDRLNAAPKLEVARTAKRPSDAAPVPASASSSSAAPTLTEIRREVLQDAVRITLVMERETSFSTERLENPARLAIDLRDVHVVYALKDARLTYSDDVVRQVRVSRQDAARTRVVLDLERPGRFSVYTLYNPYRLVVDVERQTRTVKPPTIAGNVTKPVDAAAGSSTAAPKTATKPPAQTSAAAVTPQAPAVVARDTGRPPTSIQTTSTPTASAKTPARTSVTTPPARSTYSLSRQLGLGAARIVIDAGHGGHDPGAQVEGLDESALVLDVALRLEQILLKSPGVEVIMTRRSNEFVPLEERTAIANKAAADLFLSVHANASPNEAARGIETYFLNFAPNKESEAIAARENTDSGKTMRNLSDIVQAIALNDKLDESRDFAMRVQSSLYGQLRKTNHQAKSLGVKQAPFQVLIGARMPSVLAEISFITNEREGDLLKTDKYRQQIASALAEGILGYQRSLKDTRTASRGAD